MKIIRNILMICFSLLIYHPLYGKCSNLQIGKMVKMGLSEEEITEVCGKPTIKSEDKPKPVVEEPKPVVEEPKPVEEDLKISDESERPYQAQIILLSTLGSGISLFYNFKNDIGFGVDSQNISASFSGTSYTHNVESNLNFSTTYLSARYYLLEIMPSFFIQGGYISRSWTIETIGTDRTITSRVSKIKTKYPNNALNAGFGWNWMSNLGISGGIHFISIVGDGPTHTYSIASGSTFDKASYETLIDENVPNSTLHLNLGYNFNF